MNHKAGIDADHNTLTDVVKVLGETRGEMHQRFDHQDKEFNQFKNEVSERFNRLDKDVTDIKKEVAAIKETLNLILSKFSQ